MIKTTVLPNGLNLVVESIPHVESVAYTLFIPGGIIHDDSSRVGECLLLAELTSRGAAELDSVQFSNALDDLGMRHSEGASQDRYEYRGLVIKEKFPDALRYLALMVQEPRLEDSEIPGIKSLLQQDIDALHDNPARRAILDLTSRYFPAPYNRSSLGDREGIDSITAESVKTLWQKSFLPSGAVLSVAGNVTYEEAFESVTKHFSEWKGQAASAPEFGELAVRQHCHIHFDSAQLQIAFAYPSAKIGESHYYPAKVATEILSGGMFGRLFIEVREKRGLCYSVFSRHSANRYTGTIMGYAGTTPERAQETLDVMVRELHYLHGTITEEELTRARSNMLSALVISEESSSSRAASNASDFWHMNRVRELGEIKEAINSVTSAAVYECLEKYSYHELSLLTLGSRDLVFEREIK